jgi:hypothetical protein
MHSVAVDAKGLVYAVGAVAVEPDGRHDGWIDALDADGMPRWSDRYNGPADLWDAYYDVVVDGNGNVYVAGIEETQRTSWGDDLESEMRLIVLKYGSDGERRWRQTAELPDTQFFGPVALDLGPNDRLVVGTDAVADGAGGWATLLVLVLATNGALLEVREPAFDDYRGFEFGDLDVDASGNVYLGATAVPNGVGDDEDWVASWDEAGELRWSVGEEHRGALTRAVVADEDGVVILGRIDTQPTAPVARGLWIRRYDGEGNEAWTYQTQWPDDGSMLPNGLASDCRSELAVLGVAADVPWLGRLSTEGDLVESLGFDDASSVDGLATDPGGNLVLVRRICDATCEHRITKLAW